MSSRIRRLKGELGASRVGAETLSASMAVMIRKGCGEAQSRRGHGPAFGQLPGAVKSCTRLTRVVDCAHQARFLAIADSLALRTLAHRIFALRTFVYGALSPVSLR
nr:hypothetical protein BOH68_13955 [Cobetia sp. MM1IDA2H-1]